MNIAQNNNNFSVDNDESETTFADSRYELESLIDS